MSSPLCICISISERGESKTRRHAAQGRAISVAMDGENLFHMLAQRGQLALEVLVMRDENVGCGFFEGADCQSRSEGLAIRAPSISSVTDCGLTFASKR